MFLLVLCVILHVWILSENDFFSTTSTWIWKDQTETKKDEIPFTHLQTCCKKGPNLHFQFKLVVDWSVSQIYLFEFRVVDLLYGWIQQSCCISTILYHVDFNLCRSPVILWPTWGTHGTHGVFPFFSPEVFEAGNARFEGMAGRAQIWALSIRDPMIRAPFPPHRQWMDVQEFRELSHGAKFFCCKVFYLRKTWGILRNMNVYIWPDWQVTDTLRFNFVFDTFKRKSMGMHPSIHPNVNPQMQPSKLNIYRIRVSAMLVVNMSFEHCLRGKYRRKIHGNTTTSRHAKHREKIQRVAECCSAGKTLHDHMLWDAPVTVTIEIITFSVIGGFL